MRTLITGAAGFIGSALALKLLQIGHTVIGIDNHNAYYDPSLKEDRTALASCYPNYSHHRIDLTDQFELNKCFTKNNPNYVVNLAAQAGVRYSIDNPRAYIDSNILGFANVLEACRIHGVDHLVYASSSSVYGANTRIPFSVSHNTDHPLSIYAASKKSNELMAHAYSNLFGIPTTGLRFFTVYGPWGRPDMALFKFTSSILSNEKIQVYNHGNHRRDFTYIDDIIEGIIRVLKQPARSNHAWRDSGKDNGSSFAPWRLYNIGNSEPVELMTYIAALEQALGMNARLEFLPIQPGDVPETHADINELVTDFDYRPTTPVQVGIGKFVEWYRSYYKKGC